MKIEVDEHGQYSEASIVYINAVMIQFSLNTVSEAINHIKRANDETDTSKAKAAQS